VSEQQQGAAGDLLSLNLDELVAATDRTILELLAEWEEPITAPMYEQIRYHLGYSDPAARPGKRMRPLLGLLAYASISPDWDRALPGAAAVELGHNFSLVHDDIEDGDAERRGRPTLWVRDGVPQAINTGDALFTISRVALHHLTKLGFSDSKVIRLMKLYDETCLRLCEGQFIDIAASARTEMQSVEHYFEMIGRKTAALISGSVESGAILASDDEEVIRRFRNFGWALGLAFQINDDLLGIWGDEATTGKEASDLARHKKTLPVLHAMEQASPADRAALTSLYAEVNPGAESVAAGLQVLERTGSREYTRLQAQEWRAKAISEIRALSQLNPRAVAKLEEIIDRVISA
jgi:geranylgeranyl diphosphate synthase, type I